MLGYIQNRNRNFLDFLEVFAIRLLNMSYPIRAILVRALVIHLHPQTIIQPWSIVFRARNTHPCHQISIRTPQAQNIRLCRGYLIIRVLYSQRSLDQSCHFNQSTGVGN